jgi:hypothetical protein
MKWSIETLPGKFGSGGGFLRSHPTNEQWFINIEVAIDKL